MNAFLAGFLSASALFSAAAVVLYFRARRRVRKFQQALADSRKAKTIVGEACEQVYSKP